MLKKNIQKNYTKTEFISEKDKLNIFYKKDFLDKNTADRYYRLLEKYLVYEDPERTKIVLAGIERYIPRKQVAYGNRDVYYSFAGNLSHARCWDIDINEMGKRHQDSIICTIITKILKKVEEFTSIKYNYVLINRYKDGNDYIGFHSDSESYLDQEAGIVGVTFGAERDFQFQPQKKLQPVESPATIEFVLHHGSLIHMRHPTNSYWKHSVPKRTNVTQPRISLTFRHVFISDSKNNQ